MDAFDASTLPQKRRIEVDVNKEKSGRKTTRKYESSYLNFGFTVAEREGVEHPQCLICCKVLAAECMLPSKLKRHLTTNHNLFGKPRKFFSRKLSEMNKQSVLFSNFLHTPANAQLASFKVAYRIGKCKIHHTIAEELVLAAAALHLGSTLIGESVAQKLKAVPLSNNIICWRIDKISEDSSDQLEAKMRGNEFSLQLDEATTSTSNKDAYLICCIRFFDNDDHIVED